MKEEMVFAQVRIDEELGTIVWPNGADLAPDFLHGDFEAVRPEGERGWDPAKDPPPKSA